MTTIAPGLVVVDSQSITPTGGPWTLGDLGQATDGPGLAPGPDLAPGDDVAPGDS